MIQNKLVSIIMPAYNAEKFIPSSIESVLSQTYRAWELLIVNDCSIDSTPRVVQEYCDKDNRIRLFYNEKNSGPAITRNNAIKSASGRYVAFLDSDDIWLPEKLEKQIAVMEKHRYSFTYTGYHRISQDGLTNGRQVSVPSQLNYKQLLRNTAIVTSSVVLNVDAVGAIKMKNTYYDDFVCWLEIMKRGFVAHGINEILVRYRVTTGSVSRNKLRSAYQVWKTYRSIESLNLITAVSCFAGYALNAIRKYRKF